MAYKQTREISFEFPEALEMHSFCVIAIKSENYPRFFCSVCLDRLQCQQPLQVATFCDSNQTCASYRTRGTF